MRRTKSRLFETIYGINHNTVYSVITVYSVFKVAQSILLPSAIKHTNKALYWSYMFKMISLVNLKIKSQTLQNCVSKYLNIHNCQFYMGALEKISVCCPTVNHRLNQVM